MMGKLFWRDHPADVDWPRYGTFKWRKPKGYATFGPVTVDWLGQSIDFIPDPKTADGVREALATANGLLADQAQWQSQIATVAIRDGYPLWKDRYREDEEPLLSPEDWWAEILIMFVAFDTEGRFEFMLYGGDGPLHGLKLVARGTLLDGVTEVTD